MLIKILPKNKKNLRLKMNKEKTEITQPHIHWDVREGDLVKIKTFSWDGRTELEHGVITEKLDREQQSMFPIVKVYIFERQALEELYAYNIEVISRNCEAGRR